MTVIDLSGGAVAADLVDLSVAAGGVDPAVGVLLFHPPPLDLAAALAPGELADVLALWLAWPRSEPRPGSSRSTAPSSIGSSRALDGERAPSSLARVAAALRALAQVAISWGRRGGGPITEREAAKIAALYGQGATDRVVLERALGF